uniref:Uncharacterized protein n=1 Tax=Utricularia reniformis TaxID=192314 RepID=A0A1Y0B2E6_9LAMI|nr:hypothetical protein AEK19_MT1370 [Utricularia reniformis]ART31567.1 hypothetical protein AEK19_MT1370 [Utricularia reniformis]
MTLLAVADMIFSLVEELLYTSYGIDRAERSFFSRRKNSSSFEIKSGNSSRVLHQLGLSFHYFKVAREKDYFDWA